MITKLSGLISSSRNGNSVATTQKDISDLVKIRDYLLELREIKLKEWGVIP